METSMKPRPGVMAEIERLTRENEQLRATISKTATAVGAVVSPECSLDFMALLPDEARALVRRLTRERDEARLQRDEWERAASQQARKVVSAEAEVERLREALGPLLGAVDLVLAELPPPEGSRSVGPAGLALMTLSVNRELVRSLVVRASRPSEGDSAIIT